MNDFIEAITEFGNPFLDAELLILISRDCADDSVIANDFLHVSKNKVELFSFLTKKVSEMKVPQCLRYLHL